MHLICETPIIFAFTLPRYYHASSLCNPFRLTARFVITTPHSKHSQFAARQYCNVGPSIVGTVHPTLASSSHMIEPSSGRQPLALRCAFRMPPALESSVPIHDMHNYLPAPFAMQPQSPSCTNAVVVNIRRYMRLRVSGTYR